MTTSVEAVRRRLETRVSRSHIEQPILYFLVGSSLISVLTTMAIVYVLVSEAIPFFYKVSPWEFLTGRVWSPQIEPFRFGVLPLITGTMHIVVGSALIGVPLGLGAAIYLSEYASSRVRAILKPFLEVLAGIPTVVYGYFALTFITPLLREFIPNVQIYNSLSGAIVVGVMILPTVASLCEDALRAVPNSLRDGAYALGATKYEVTVRIAVPAALSGIMAAFILGLSRAIGETMAVTLAAGATPNLTIDPRENILTMTAFMANLGLGEAERGGPAYQALYAVGLLLFVFTLGLNILSNRILRRFRESYE